MMALIPVVAIAPILLYIGMLIGAQAFQETPHSHAPAIVLGLVPHLAAWGKLQIDGALTAAGTNAATVGFDKLGQVGILYHGLEVLGGGAIIGGLVLAAIGVFVIEREFVKAAGLLWLVRRLRFSASCTARRSGLAGVLRSRRVISSWRRCCTGVHGLRWWSGATAGVSAGEARFGGEARA